MSKRLAISPESFIALLQKLGANYETQSGFVKVHGPDGRKMYVGRGKICGTVHLSGWTSANGDSEILAKSPSKLVEHEMRFDEQDAVSQLRLFARLYAEMMALPPRQKTERKSSANTAQPVLIDPELVLNALPVAQAEEAPEAEA